MIYFHISGLCNLEMAFATCQVRMFDILCFVETWHLKEFCGYEAFYWIKQSMASSSGAGRPSGGLIVMINKHLNYMITSWRTELLWIRCTMEGPMDNYLIIYFVYSPPSSDLSAILSEIYLDSLDYSDYEMVCAGDFNARVGDRDQFYDDTFPCRVCNRNTMDLVTNSRSEVMLQFIQTLPLIILNGRTTSDPSGSLTYVGQRGGSLIDLALVSPNIMGSMIDFEVKQWAISDHLPILITYGMENESETIIPPGSIIRKRADWKQDEIISFTDSVWDKCNSKELPDGLDSQYDFLTSVLIQVASDKGLIRDCGLRSRNNNQWYDRECRLMKKLVGQSLVRFRKQNTDSSRMEFVTKRNEYKNLYRNKRQEYNKNLIDQLNNAGPTQFWNVVNRFRYKGNNLCTIDVDTWTEYYKKLYTESFQCDRMDMLEIFDPILDAPISWNELSRIIDRMSNDKSPGLDNIRNEYIKASPLGFKQMLLAFYNGIIEDKKVPKCMARSLIVSIYKKDDPKQPENYRPISLLPSITKIFTGVLNKRLTKWTNVHNIIHESQSGFRVQRSTIDNLFVVTAMIHLGIHKKRGKLYALFVDASRAFDSVHHEILWSVLYGYGVSSRFIGVLQQYYYVASAQFLIGTMIDGFVKLERGVMQGDSISPLLFNIYINQLPTMLEASGVSSIGLGNCSVHCTIFADDILIVADSPVGLQKKINVLDTFFKSRRLNINMSKSKVLIFKNGNNTSKKHSFYWKNTMERFEIQECYTYLGVPLHANGSFFGSMLHFEARAKRAMSAIWSTVQKINSGNFSIYLRLYRSLLTSVLLYASPIWAHRYYDLLERFQMLFIKKLFRLPRAAPGYLIRLELGLPPISFYIIKAIIRLWIKILYMSESRYPRAALSVLKNNYGKTIGHSLNWFSSLTGILNMNGYTYLIDVDDAQTVQIMSTSLLTTIYDNLRQRDISRLNNSSFYSSFYSLRDTVVPPGYLYHTRYLKYVRLMLQLKIFNGKWINCEGHHFEDIGLECELCNLGASGDFAHVFLICPILKFNRMKYFDHKLIDDLVVLSQGNIKFVKGLLERVDIRILYQYMREMMIVREKLMLCSQ